MTFYKKVKKEISQPQKEILSGPLPGDKIVRPIRFKRPKGLRRILGVGALYSMAYGDVGSSIYYALGITAFYALGATPLALGIASLFFVFTTFTYAEGSSMFTDSGGSASFARHGFNNLIGFVSGWALLLVYIVTISISALSAAYYMSYFYPSIKTVPLIGGGVAMTIIVFLIFINIIGIRESAKLNLFFTIIDLLTQISLVILGLIFLLNIQKILGYINWKGTDNWPTINIFIHSIAIGMVGFMGLETAAQMAEETKDSQRNIPKSLMLTMVTVVFMFVVLPIIAVSAMPPQELKNKWFEDPIAGIANHLPTIYFSQGDFTFSIPLAKAFAPWVAILASTILIVAANAGLTAASRLAFYFSENKNLPPTISKLHHKFRTPYIAIIFFSVIGILLLVPSAYSQKVMLLLADLYRFAGMLAFSLANLSLIFLRIRKPIANRPFKAPFNIKIFNREISVTAILGFAGTFSVWITILFLSPIARNIGFLWLFFGIAIYVSYRKKQKLSIL